MKKLVLVLFAASFVSACFAEDQVFTFTNKKGTVTFQHTAHQNRLGGAESCASCHPAFEQKYNDNVLVMKIAHVTCKACHEEREVGPQDCTDCHKL